MSYKLFLLTVCLSRLLDTATQSPCTHQWQCPIDGTGRRAIFIMFRLSLTRLSVSCAQMTEKTDLFHCPVCLFQTGQTDWPFSLSRLFGLKKQKPRKVEFFVFNGFWILFFSYNLNLRLLLFLFSILMNSTLVYTPFSAGPPGIPVREFPGISR